MERLLLKKKKKMTFSEKQNVDLRFSRNKVLCVKNYFVMTSVERE
jgi:hypothetical protein